MKNDNFLFFWGRTEKEDDLLEGLPKNFAERIVFYQSDLGQGKILPNLKKKVRESSPKVIFFFITMENSLKQQKFALDIKDSFPALSIVLTGPGLNLEFAVREMKNGKIDRIIRASTFGDLMLQLLADKNSPNSRTLWKDEQGVIQWNREERAKGPKAKVLLVLMPAWNNDFAPYGLAHISAALRNAEYNVEVLDLNWLFWQDMKERFVDCSEYLNVLMWSEIDRYRAKVEPHLAKVFDVLKKKIETGDFSFVGFSIFLTNMIATEDAFKVVRRLKPATKIFCGGPSCTDFWAEKFISLRWMDGAVFGEGEVSVVEMLDMWTKGEDRTLAGSFVRGADGKIKKGPTRPLANINLLPTPDFSDFNIYNYEKFMLPTHFGRGCVAKCTFCSETEYWVRYRILKPESVVSNIERNVELYGIRQYHFNDSLMNGSHKHLEKFVDGILEKNISIRFQGYCRLEPELSAALLDKMAKAGCFHISFGMESGSQKVTDLMRKETKVHNYSPIIKDVHTAGINSAVCVIVGFPGETWKDYFKTVFMLMRLRPYISDLNLSILTLHKDMDMGRELEHFGVLPGNYKMWRTVDGRNTPAVRFVRYWLLKNIWKWLKARRVSPTGWNLEKREYKRYSQVKSDFINKMLRPISGWLWT